MPMGRRIRVGGGGLSTGKEGGFRIKLKSEMLKKFCLLEAKKAVKV